MLKVINKPLIATIAFIFIILFTPTLYAQSENTNSNRSIGEFLAPDGSFDLETARKAGFQGSLNAEGFKPDIDNATGQPVFRPVPKISTEPNPDDVYWDNSMSNSIPGIDGTVNVLAIYDDKLIVGGKLSIAGDVRVYYHIASWDGLNWSGLDGGLDGWVNALTVYDGKLIVGGNFSHPFEAWDFHFNNIAAWDGSSWSALGDGMTGARFSDVNALTVYNGKLIAGGHFDTAGGVSVNKIALWDGLSWSPLGEGVNSSTDSLDTDVESLTVYNGKLIAAGYFDTAGGVSANYIASWNGLSWSALGKGMSNEGNPYTYIYALTVYDNKLVAGGYFSAAGDISSNGIAMWDGTSWSPFGIGLSNDACKVKALEVFGGKLIVGGWFITEGAESVRNIAIWDGLSWTSPGSGMGDKYPHPQITCLTIYNGKLIVGGEFTEAGGVPVVNIAAWDGSSWSSLEKSLFAINSQINAFTIYDGKLIVGGSFTLIRNGEKIKSIAAWDGNSWFDLGANLEGDNKYYTNPQVDALIVYDDKLIAGGMFTIAGDIPIKSIASWDGSSWSSLGEGPGIEDSHVYDLTLFEGKLIAGGRFYTEIGANYIASWDGTSWTFFGKGLNEPVNVLEVYNGKLIAAGGITTKNIVEWDGSSWSPVGNGVSGNIYALAGYNDKLFIGGGLYIAGDGHADHLAMWDSVSWTPLGEGMSTLYTLTTIGDKLIVGGDFNSYGYSITAWDGSSWSSYGSGIWGGVRAITIFQDELIVGGDFTIVGGKVGFCIAAWTKRDSTDVVVQTELPSVQKLSPNYPNPFNPSTTINFSIPAESRVIVKIYNIAGQEVAALKDEIMPAGNHEIIWNAKGMPSGIYFCTVNAGEFTETRKMTLVK